MSTLTHTDPGRVPEDRRLARRPPVALVLTIPGLLAIAAAVAFPVSFDKPDFPDTSVSVALGVFGVILTALTIAMALVVDVGARWPSATNLVQHSMLAAWFAVSFAAVLVSVVATSVKSDFLVVLSLGMSLSGALLGSWSVYRVLSVSSGHRRHDFLAGLLADALTRETARVSAPAESSELRPYLSDVDAAVDAQAVDVLGARLAELEDAIPTLPPERLWIALDLVIRLVQRTGRAALMERMDSEVSASLIPGLLTAASELTGRLVREDPRHELRASVYLGQLARTLAWFQAAADRRIETKEGSVAPMRRLMVTTLQGRRALAQGMHPDPPRRPVTSALPSGLTSPRAAVVWLWGFVDFNGSDRGSGMYGFHAAVTGQRFLGAYEDDSILKKTAQHLYGAQSGRPVVGESRTLFGKEPRDFRRCMLELAATALAGPRPLARKTPDGLRHEVYLSDDRQYAWIHARLMADHEPQETADEALEDLAYLLGAPARRRIEPIVCEEYERLDALLFPKLISPAARPAACVLACALPLADAKSRWLRSFVEALPRPLLRVALEDAERRFCKAAQEDGDHAKRFIRLLEEVRAAAT